MKRFPGKVLLFGEYSLLFGAKALTVPLHLFGGQLQFWDNSLETESSEAVSALEIDRFVSYFDHHQLNDEMTFSLDLLKLKQDIKEGLYFQSDIPLQYGVGSSGALCAAIFDQYSPYRKKFRELIQKKDFLESLKKDFSIMERYFHGTSSGLDPLVSFLDQPVLLDEGHVFLPKLKHRADDFAVYLVDTKVKSPTEPLVHSFLDKMKETSFEAKFRQEYLPVNNKVVDAFGANKTDELFGALEQLVLFQLKYFSEMIPAGFVENIRGLHEQGIYIKLLGSGGGGFLLAFVPDGKPFSMVESSIKLEL